MLSKSVELLCGNPDLVVRACSDPCVAPPEHQRAGAFGVGCGEQDGHRPTLRHCKQRRLLRAGGVHDRFDVEHAAVDIWQSLRPV